ncbi:hypothetical protein EUX98_g5784 [Antrodiella citrinella]|uniref:SH3 domain-containing protein n=1 Tax=Antrodiella citrinella TaxID=2447956 RepID=A0A4S4MQL6_9APHY|nr:hypothetical protein EUX98_g5784 [Antrodiella citrinella]
MHNIKNHPVERVQHRRLFKRQHLGGVIDGGNPVPAGFTVTEVTVTETFKMDHTTVLETETLSVAIPITATPTPSPSPSPVVPATTSSSSSSSTPISSSPPASQPPASPTSSPLPTSTPLASPPVSSSATSLGDGVPSGALASSKGLSGGAIGGIVAAFLIVGIAVALFFVRKQFLRKRKQQRVTWGNNLYPKTGFVPETTYANEKSEVYGDIPPPPPEKKEMSSAPASTEVLSSFPMPPPPPTSYNNLPPPSPNSAAPLVSPPPIPVIQSPVPTLQPAMGSPAVTLTPAVDTNNTVYAYVKCTFIPTLPDELSITTGELVRVLGEFDDGWALCANTRNDQGVVPLECLDRSQLRHSTSSMGYMGQGTGDWRMSRRASSLYATSPQGAAAMRA